MKNKWKACLAAVTALTGAAATAVILAKKNKGKHSQTTAERYEGKDMPENVASADPTYRDKTKRLLDIVICAPAFVLALIPMAITALAVKLDSPGPVLFRQKRLGLGGKEFEMLKFRSMCDGAEHTGSGVYSDSHDARVTRVGKFIRATSLDELPQLINILRGDMSLIGPRPPLTYHPWPIDEYTDEQRRMFDVRPGITGWAQTHGRKDVEWHHRIELNVWYVDHVSLALDIRIFFSTILKVLSNADNKNIGKTLQEEKTETSNNISEEIRTDDIQKEVVNDISEENAEMTSEEVTEE